MKKLILTLVAAIITITLSGNVAFAKEETVPEKPIDIEESETRDVYVIGTRTLDYTGLTGNIKFLTNGTATKITDAWGNIAYTYDLSTSLYSYTVTSGIGYATLSSYYYYTTPGHRLMVHVTAIWHGGTQDGTEIDYSYYIY